MMQTAAPIIAAASAPRSGLYALAPLRLHLLLVIICAILPVGGSSGSGFHCITVALVPH